MDRYNEYMEAIRNMSPIKRDVYNFLVRECRCDRKIIEKVNKESNGPTMKEIFDSFTDLEKEATYFVVGNIVETRKILQDIDLINLQDLPF